MNATMKKVIIALTLLAPLGRSGFAAEAPAPDPEMVIVPYDASKPAAEQKPDQFYLPYERFLQLWQAAKQNRTDRKLEAAVVPFVLSNARYEGVLAERAMTFTGKLDITTYNESWVGVPLPFTDVKISALKIDGVAAAYDGTQIVVEKPGRHQVEVSFEIPFQHGVQTLDWGVPRTGATMLVLTLPADRTRATVSPGSGVVEQVENGKKRISAALGSTSRVHVEWKASAAAARIADPALATISTRLVSRIGREEITSEVAFAFPGARQDHFTVYFEKGLTLTMIDAINIKSWRLAPEDTRQALEIVLNEPVEELYSVLIGTERPLASLPAELKSPAFSAAARRVEYSGVALCIGDRLELTPKPDPAQRQIPWNGPLGTGNHLVAAYAGAGQAGYHVALRETQREARVDYVYQVNRRKIELLASLQLFAHGDDLSAATLSLPAQFEVQAVESERLQDWWREGDTLHLRFRGTTPESTPLVVYLVRQYAAAPTELDVRPLVLDGFKKVEGEAVVAAHKGVEASMKLSADAKEMAPGLAATDFQILPPLERKRGFAFKSQTFAAQVALTALPARTSAVWVMHAQAHEGWVSVSAHARLTMRQGSIDRVTFSLPAGVNEARVSGDEVREVRSRVEGDRRIYEVQFQNDVYEAVEFTADLELPNPGKVALPGIAFPEAQMTSGYVLADNASEYEMKIEKSGVDSAPSEEIPFLPDLSKNASIFRTQPDWTVTIVAERLEKATARAAFVAWAELTTALRPDGTEWHRAAYRLQNRSLQFLPVKMPAGAELVSVRVAGQAVRADAGQVDGVAAILVPLIKTKPGDLSYDVELVYRQNRAALGWWARRDLDDPELLGITVERTFWNVWVPEDRKLQSSSGNMEAVLEEVNKAEKLEGSLQELKSLVTIANCTTASLDTRWAAVRNVERLKEKIQIDNRDENFAQTEQMRREAGKAPSPTPAEESVGKKGIAQQGAYVANKRREINDQLGREVQKLGEGTQDLNQQSQMVGQQTLTLNQSGHVVGQNPLNSGLRSGLNAISANAIDALLFGQPNATVINQGTVQSANPVNPQSERWSANGAFVPQGKVSATPPPPANIQGNNNVYFNDNVVLQQKQTQQEPKSAELAQKPQANFAMPSNQNVFFSGGTAGSALPVPQQATAPANQAKGNAQIENNGQSLVLNTARGNNLRYQEEQSARQQQQTSQQVQTIQPNASQPAITLAPPNMAMTPQMQMPCHRQPKRRCRMGRRCSTWAISP